MPITSLAARYRINRGAQFSLNKHDSQDTAGIKGKKQARKLLNEGIAKIRELQDRLYAEGRSSLLLIFQAMDAAGKDGAIKHVMSGINPQGCVVHSFKQPSSNELDHDFLWRTTCRLPPRGMIGIFNRSYYEEVLITKVHPEILHKQRLPHIAKGNVIWKQRYQSINDLEKHLSRNGTVVRKFFLNLGIDEQKRRFLKRIDDPARNWKFSPNDLSERGHWDAYQKAYQDAIRNTASHDAPWYVVPADHKWFSRLVVAQAIIDALQSINPQYPTVSDTQRETLQESRKQLVGKVNQK
ncbi:MAG: polyphosphate kinase 2 family protein [Planctomycetota bacterium]|nr:MAG: polyphosphate kinase 2 family protein [Planctomycetota bacterium]